MERRQVLCGLAAVGIAAAGFGGPAVAEGYRISGPHTHGNLAIYLVHGKSAPGPVPLTLQEAVAKGAVQVHETGNVNELQIENIGGEEVFVQSGDIVKGGKQDRVLMVSMVVPPKSGRVPVASFCVEQGRWQARGREDVSRFASADAALPSRKAKIAMKAPAKPAENTGGEIEPRPGRLQTRDGRVISSMRAPQSDTALRQREVWNSVAETQTKLARGLGTGTVAAAQSASSLQLSLENDRLREKRAEIIAKLREVPTGDDVVGFVFAINGKLNSADVYPSNGLFRKMWGKLLDAAATEAIGEQDGETGALPTPDAVLAFLSAAEQGTAQADRKLTPAVTLATRENDRSLYFATERAGGGWVHRNYLAK